MSEGLFVGVPKNILRNLNELVRKPRTRRQKPGKKSRKSVLLVADKYISQRMSKDDQLVNAKLPPRKKNPTREIKCLTDHGNCHKSHFDDLFYLLFTCFMWLPNPPY